MQKTKIDTQQTKNDETPEIIFFRYNKNRSIQDLQKLYNLGIYLHVSKNGKLEVWDDWEVKPEQNMIPAYDKIDGEMVFTKIWVY